MVKRMKVPWPIPRLPLFSSYREIVKRVERPNRDTETSVAVLNDMHGRSLYPCGKIRPFSTD